MTKDITFSRYCIIDKIPDFGHRCVFCMTPLVKSSSAYKFANIDPKNIRRIQYAYSHISCCDKRTTWKKDEIPDEIIKKIWDGVENLQKLGGNR